MTPTFSQNQWEKEKNECSSLRNETNSLFFLRLLLFFLPTQLAFHTWPYFSYVYGLRIDYLSPTLYVTDVLFFLAAIYFLSNRSARTYLTEQLGKKSMYLLVFWIGMVLNCAYSFSPLATLYGSFKLLEMVGIGFLFIYFLARRNRSWLIVPFLMGTSVQALLAIWQYLLQSSVGGVWYYLGERAFTGLTPGIANASIAGHLVLRPYGTLPHPNLLGAYLLIGAMLLLYLVMKGEYEKRTKIILTCSLSLHAVALLITLSRTSIIAGCVGLLVVLLSKRSNANQIVRTFIVLSVFFMLVLLPTLVPRFMNVFTDQSYGERMQYTRESIQLIKSHIIMGVGWNAYLPSLETLPHVSTIQPVHSIYLLTLAQAGAVGAVIIAYPVYVFIGRIKAMKSRFAYVLLGILLFLGAFDHYFLTIQQGQLLFVFLVALIVTQNNSVINV